MKATDTFKTIIKEHLDAKAGAEQLFAEKYNNPDKNIDDCITYILNTVKNSGKQGFADEEVFGMAIHYYDEESIEVGKPINAKVVVNRVIELSDEEKADARQKAIEQYQQEALEKMQKKATPKVRKKEAEVEQPSLFDL